MNLKTSVIAAAALAVVGFALYLFIQVRRAPAPPRVTEVAHPADVQARQPQPTPPPPAAPVKPAVLNIKTPADATALWQKQAAPQLGREVDGAPAPTKPDPGQLNVKVDAMMELANKAYDAQDFDQAIAIAGKVLSKEPDNTRMLRILVSANCIQGDGGAAQQYYDKLPDGDKEQMRARCDRYGVTFK